MAAFSINFLIKDNTEINLRTVRLKISLMS